MEEMEKQGFLTVSATHYLPIYAERITDEATLEISGGDAEIHFT